MVLHNGPLDVSGSARLPSPAKSGCIDEPAYSPPDSSGLGREYHRAGEPPPPYARIDHSEQTHGVMADKASTVPLEAPSSSLSSPISPTLNSSTPDRLFNPAKLVWLLPQRMLADRLLPWRDPSVDFRVPFPLRSDPPAWSLSLESYYGIFHPATWTMLDKEYATHRSYAASLSRERQTRKERGAHEAELGPVESALKATHEYLGLLWGSLYGLHYVRNRYLDFYRPIAPRWSDSKIVYETAELETEIVDGRIVPMYRSPDLSDLSIWPLPLPPPPPASPLPSKALTSIAGLSKRALWLYTAPEFDPSWPIHFRAKPLDLVHAKHDETQQAAAHAQDVKLTSGRAPRVGSGGTASGVYDVELGAIKWAATTDDVAPRMDTPKKAKKSSFAERVEAAGWSSIRRKLHAD
ncbi:hypothetical protein JCM10207_006077 [Rhodosporidiobolus poonsookiae]